MADIGFAVSPYQRHSGAGVYYHHLINGLIGLAPENRYVVYVPSESAPEAAREFGKERVIPVPVPNGPSFRRALAVMRYRNLPRRFGPGRLDLLHSFSYPGHVCDGANVLTVYDMRAEDVPEINVPLHNWYSRVLKASSLKRMDGIITISEFTRRRLIDRYPACRDKSQTVWLGVDRRYCPRPPGKGAPEARYVLTVGHLIKRKNYAALVKAYEIFKRKSGLPHGLIIAGQRYEEMPELFSRINQSAYKGQIEVTGALDDDGLLELYQGADLFVFPSLYEGFGLPAFEALACGVPVLTSDSSVFPEFFSHDMMFSPHDENGMADKMVRALRDASYRKKILSEGLRALGKISWDRTVKETLAFYMNLLAKRK